MNVDRALLTKCIQNGEVNELVSRGVSQHHFQNKSPEGQELSEVLEWLIEFTRKHNHSPSQQMFKERFPDFRFEPSSDSLGALIDAFFANVKRRIFSAKVSELARLEQDSREWNHLDEHMLDAARDLAGLVPSGKVHRFSDMSRRVEDYKREVADPNLARRYLMNIKAFDDLTGGMRPGNVVTIAGPSGRGKSLLAQWQLMSSYEQGAKGLMLSLEMTAPEIFERMDTMITKFSHKMLSQRTLADADLSQWEAIARQFNAKKNDIVVKDDLLGCNTDRVYAEVSRYKPDIVVVDYVQLMRSKNGYASQWQGLVEITNDLKQIAVANDCVVVMVSQDGRDSFENGSSETNAGGSISVYQVADIYIGLHQDDQMYAEGSMEVRLLKNRRGAKMAGKYKSALLDWRPANMQFSYRDSEETQQSERFLRAVA